MKHPVYWLYIVFDLITFNNAAYFQCISDLKGIVHKKLQFLYNSCIIHTKKHHKCIIKEARMTYAL